MEINEIIAKLKAPFPEAAIKWRVKDKETVDGKFTGTAVPYIDARDVQNRLDEVVGGGRWEVDMRPSSIGVVASIGIHVESIGWVRKSDGAHIESFSGNDEKELAVKGSFSDAFKRASVMWGVARYLYAYEGEVVDLDPKGQPLVTPKLPPHMLPESERAAAADASAQADAERVASENAQREEQERVARETAQREEQERVARETAQREEQERVARETAQREEQERVARETAQREEQERVARETAQREEQERVARETAQREEAERQAAAKQAAAVTTAVSAVPTDAGAGQASAANETLMDDDAAAADHVDKLADAAASTEGQGASAPAGSGERKVFNGHDYTDLGLNAEQEKALTELITKIYKLPYPMIHSYMSGSKVKAHLPQAAIDWLMPILEARDPAKQAAAA